MKSFEPVHGMSRVAKLIPDKLATAIAINQEKLENPEDDGSFMIDLVKNLLTFFRDQVSARLEQETEEESQESLADPVTLTSGSAVSSIEDAKDFLQVLKQFSDLLDSMKQCLKGRQLVEINAIADEIVEMSDDILSCCYIFMDFVHPVWLDVQRKGGKDEESIGKSELKLKERLEKTNGKVLQDEYKKLTEECSKE